MANLTSADFVVGSRVGTRWVDFGGFKHYAAGTVVGHAGPTVVVRWDSNEIGATQNMQPAKLLRLDSWK